MGSADEGGALAIWSTALFLACFVGCVAPRLLLESRVTTAAGKTCDHAAVDDGFTAAENGGHFSGEINDGSGVGSERLLGYMMAFSGGVCLAVGILYQATGVSSLLHNYNSVDPPQSHPTDDPENDRLKNAYIFSLAVFVILLIIQQIGKMAQGLHAERCSQAYDCAVSVTTAPMDAAHRLRELNAHAHVHQDELECTQRTDDHTHTLTHPNTCARPHTHTHAHTHTHISHRQSYPHHSRTNHQTQSAPILSIKPDPYVSHHVSHHDARMSAVHGINVRNSDLETEAERDRESNPSGFSRSRRLGKPSSSASSLTPSSSSETPLPSDPDEFENRVDRGGAAPSPSPAPSCLLCRIRCERKVSRGLDLDQNTLVRSTDARSIELNDPLDQPLLEGMSDAEEEEVEKEEGIVASGVLGQSGTRLRHPKNPEKFVDENQKFAQSSRVIFSFLLALFSIHSLAEGAGLGVASCSAGSGSKTGSSDRYSDRGASMHAIGMAIMLHKTISAFAVGAAMVKMSLSAKSFWVIAGLFSSLSPAGALVGFGTCQRPASDKSSRVQAYVILLASSTFIFISLMEFIPQAFVEGERLTTAARMIRDKSEKIGFMIAGVMLASLTL